MKLTIEVDDCLEHYFNIVCPELKMTKEEVAAKFLEKTVYDLVLKAEELSKMMEAPSEGRVN